MPLDRTETAIFAWMLKQLGGKVSIPKDQLLNLDGWLVEFSYNFEKGTFNAKLTRVGETFEGEATGLHDPPSPPGSRLRSPQRLLSMRRTFLAQESESTGDGEIPPLGSEPGEAE